ncbi:MAG: EF-P lysine aminoacylase EpmA [Gammaproteobacteria bacterium]
MLKWQSSASLETLRARADFLRRIRDFFHVRDILEVETPLLDFSSTTDPHIRSVEIHESAVFLSASTAKYNPKYKQGKLYLQTSPEFAMKRLLAFGTGSIYQICKAFRAGESGTRHNPEFSILEWYRIGFKLEDLMQEVLEFLTEIFNFKKTKVQRTNHRLSYLNYAALFLETHAIDPHQVELEVLGAKAKQLGLDTAWIESDPHLEADKDIWLDYLFSTTIQPYLGLECPVCVWGFPASQAALSKINAQGVAERFEVFYKGLELGNGYHELQNAQEQALRFDRDNKKRLGTGKPMIPKDERLLGALQKGLPACSGVALGLDRILMLSLGLSSLQEVLAFPLVRGDSWEQF